LIKLEGAVKDVLKYVMCFCFVTTVSWCYFICTYY